MQVSDNTLYYFFSSSAQAVGAIAGLLSALFVFRYQGLLEEVDDKADHIAKVFGNGGPFFGSFLDAGEQATYRDFASSSQRVEWLRQKFGPHWESGDFSKLEGIFKSKFQPPPPDLAKRAAEKIDEIRGAKPEFDELEKYVSAAKSLRRTAITVTALGLVAVAIGLFCTTSPDWLEANGNCRLIAVVAFGGLVGGYLASVGFATRRAFRRPL